MVSMIRHICRNEKKILTTATLNGTNFLTTSLVKEDFEIKLQYWFWMSVMCWITWLSSKYLDTTYRSHLSSFSLTLVISQVSAITFLWLIAIDPTLYLENENSVTIFWLIQFKTLKQIPYFISISTIFFFFLQKNLKITCMMPFKLLNQWWWVI